MSYRRRHRWFRRMALGLAFASVMFAGRASVAAAKIDEGTDGSRYVAAGGWSGQVDPESGIPLSAGIPQGDEQFIDAQAVEVIPYLSHGILTQAEADAAAAQAIHDPYLTDVFVRPGESLGGPDGDAIAFANALESQQPTVIPYLSQGILTGGCGRGGARLCTTVSDASTRDAARRSRPIRSRIGRPADVVSDRVTTWPDVDVGARGPTRRGQPLATARTRSRPSDGGASRDERASTGVTTLGTRCDDGVRPDDRADRAHSDVSLGLRWWHDAARPVGDRRARARPRPRTGARLPSPAAARRPLDRLGQRREAGSSEPAFAWSYWLSASRASSRCSNSSRSSSPVVRTSS